MSHAGWMALDGMGERNKKGEIGYRLFWLIWELGFVIIIFAQEFLCS